MAIYFGPPAGFPMEPGYAANTKLRVVFMSPGSYPVTGILYDMDPDPDWVLDTFTGTLVVNAGDFSVIAGLDDRTVLSGVPMTLTK